MRFSPRHETSGTELPCRTVLPCRTYGLAGRTQRNPSVNRGTSIGLRFDCQCTVQELQPLLHADQAQPSALLCYVEVKACAGVFHRQMNLIRRSPQAHLEVPRPTV